MLQLRIRETLIEHRQIIAEVKVTYTSDNETFGYHSAKEWFEYLTAWKRELEQPVVVLVKEGH